MWLTRPALIVHSGMFHLRCRLRSCMPSDICCIVTPLQDQEELSIRTSRNNTSALDSTGHFLGRYYKKIISFDERVFRFSDVVRAPPSLRHSPRNNLPGPGPSRSLQNDYFGAAMKRTEATDGASYGITTCTDSVEYKLEQSYHYLASRSQSWVGTSGFLPDNTADCSL